MSKRRGIVAPGASWLYMKKWEIYFSRYSLTKGGLDYANLILIKLYKNALVPLILDPSRWGRSRCEQQMVRKKKSEVIATEMDAIILRR